MFIELHNFRCYEDKKFEIPDSGKVLISGPSGKGKSTILDAIYFVLYGEGKNVIKDGNKKNKCFVKFYYKNMIVTRTKNPKSLKIVTINERKKGKKSPGSKSDTDEFVDEAAQDIINKIFGTNFISTSYIPQKCIDNFLQKTPKEKTDFIMSLAFPDEEKVTLMKKKVREKIREQKDVINEIGGKVEIVKQEVKESEQKIVRPKAKISYEAKDKKDVLNKIEERRKGILLCDEKKNKANQKISELSVYEEKKYFYTCEIEKLSSQEIKIVELPEDVGPYEKKLNLIRKNREAKVLETKIDELKIEVNEMSEKYIKEKEEKLKVLNSALSLIEEGNLPGDISVELQKIYRYEELKPFVDELKTIDFPSEDKSQLINLYNSEKAKCKCPNCGVVLEMANNGELKEKKVYLSDEELQKVKDKINYIVKYQSKYNTLKEKKREFDLLDIKEDVDMSEKKAELLKKKEDKKRRDKILEQISELKTEKTPSYIVHKKDMLSTLISKQQKLKVQIPNIPKETEEELVEKINELKIKNVEYQQYLKTSQSIKAKMTEIKNCLDKLVKPKQTLAEYQKIIEKCDKKKIRREKVIKLYNKKLEKIKIYEEYLSRVAEHKKWVDRLSEYQKEEKESGEKLALYEKLYKKILETENMTIQTLINNLNILMDMYLEKFFKDEDLKVEIKCFKPTDDSAKGKGGEGKPCVYVTMEYKNNSIDITTLSGGEHDRVVLAMVLAFNKLFGSQFLLLDEFVSSLDSELCTSVLNEIQQLFPEKLILLVAHQIEQGQFDKIISLE